MTEAPEREVLIAEALQAAKFYAERYTVDEQQRCPSLEEMSRREALEQSLLLKRLAEALQSPAPAGWKERPDRIMTLEEYQTGQWRAGRIVYDFEGVPGNVGVWFSPQPPATAPINSPATAGDGWHMITEGPDESVAPWNGEPVLIVTDHMHGNRVHRAIWTDAVHGHGIHGWAVEDRKFGPYALRGYMNVTHWMPLPAPPAPVLSDAGEERK